MALRFKSARFKLPIVGAMWAALLMFSPSQLSARDHSANSDHAGHEAMSMTMDEQPQMDAAQQRKLLADKKESEFNHHLAGFFVILAGIFILSERTLNRRWSFLRFAWPACFLLSGLFLLVFSDTSCGPLVHRAGGTVSPIISKICSTRRLP